MDGAHSLHGALDSPPTPPTTYPDVPPSELDPVVMTRGLAQMNASSFGEPESDPVLPPTF
jgi:hypothetical protein